MKQSILVKQEKFTPHGLVNSGDSGQVTERVSGEILQLFRVIACHQRHGDTVGKLRNKAYHLVVVIRRQF